MAVTIVNNASASGTSIAHTLTSCTISTPTDGRTMLLAVFVDSPSPPEVPVYTPTGWTLRSGSSRLKIYTKVAGSAESNTVTVTHGATNYSAMCVLEFSEHAAWDTYANTVDATLGTSMAVPSITPQSGVNSILLAISGVQPPYDWSASPSGYSNIVHVGLPGGLQLAAFKKAVTPASGSYSTTINFAGPVRGNASHVAISEIIPLTADFDATPRSGTDPLTVAFTDESIGGMGTIDGWLWDFGDGATSTSANPSHQYIGVGQYTVTLTVTTDDDETDSLTRVAYIDVTGDYEAPDPGGAILEIKASAVGSARWDVALWDEAVWSSAEWVDVTPQGITVQIRWGSHSPERGILAEIEAASWLVTTYDPDRLLDPGNPDGPYVTDLKAGLPIRLRHRGTIIRQGIVERIAYSHADNQGGIRATDNVSLMARSPVPSDSVVADTLRARARDVIAAAGLSITVEPDPPSGDPALAPRIEGDRSVWRHIADAAEQTLHVAYVDRVGTVKFRPWASPYDRARGVDERNLVDLMTQVDTAGLFSVVQARDSITEDIEERALTPTPRYGKVVYTRDELTIDAGDWAATVLADRGLQTVQWIPGLIWPLTADDVEYFATLEAVERFGVEHHGAVPEVDITGVIIGGTVNVKGKKDSAAMWTFELELAQTADSPLYTDTDPPEFLLNEAGDGYLYAD